MDYVIMKPRLVWVVLFRALGAYVIYLTIYAIFFEGLELQLEFLGSFVFASFSFGVSCCCIEISKDGALYCLKFGSRSFFGGKKIAPWDYAMIDIGWIFPFYLMDGFERQYRSYPFFLFANFLDLIIFIQKEIPHDKMNPKSRERIRLLAKKYRKLKKKHRILYWILNNV